MKANRGGAHAPHPWRLRDHVGDVRRRADMGRNCPGAGWRGAARRRRAGGRHRCLRVELAALRAQHDSCRREGRRQLPVRATRRTRGAAPGIRRRHRTVGRGRPAHRGVSLVDPATNRARARAGSAAFQRSPGDASVRERLEAELTTLKNDAELIGDATLQADADVALDLLARGGSGDMAALQETITAIAEGRAAAPAAAVSVAGVLAVGGRPAASRAPA